MTRDSITAVNDAPASRGSGPRGWRGRWARRYDGAPHASVAAEPHGSSARRLQPARTARAIGIPWGGGGRLLDALGQAGRALRHRNFRLFTAGQTVSLTGTWMQQVAVSWLVYRLTGSPFLLGLVAFVGRGPTFILAPIAGVIADRVDRRRMVIGTQAAGMLGATVLAVLVLTGNARIGWIIAIMAYLGAVNSFDIPARQSFLIEMVGNREDLPNAIALNSSMFNAARLVGPAIAGFAIAAFGEGPVIAVNAASYAAVIAALLAMRIESRRRAGLHASVAAHLREGVSYALGPGPIRWILGLIAVVSLTAVPFTVLLPVVATDMLGGGPGTLGLLLAATGLGALAGALHLAARPAVPGLGRVIVFAGVLFGLALLATAGARSRLVALPALTTAGFGMMVLMASSNTVLQTIVDDDKRGRVMSLYSMAFTGAAPIGSLAAGAIAARIGAPATLAIGGICCLAAASTFASRLRHLRAMIRPIYARLGILPQLAAGLQAATHDTTRGVRDIRPDEADPHEPT